MLGVNFNKSLRASSIDPRNIAKLARTFPTTCSNSTRITCGVCLNFRLSPISKVTARKGGLVTVSPIIFATTPTVFPTPASRKTNPRISPLNICIRVEIHAQSRGMVVRACGNLTSHRSAAINATIPSIISCN